MSYTWNYLQNNPKKTKRLLGITYDPLTQLIEQGKLLHAQKQAELEIQKTRLIRLRRWLPSQVISRRPEHFNFNLPPPRINISSSWLVISSE